MEKASRAHDKAFAEISQWCTRNHVYLLVPLKGKPKYIHKNIINDSLRGRHVQVPYGTLRSNEDVPYDG